jgi:redox-sensitive bicupin YhaK (pirin superfamily)
MNMSPFITYLNMKKSSFSTKGQRADIGDMAINRLLPNRYADAVGPFIFLDHILPGLKSSLHERGTGSHPHRGIATLTYILDGEDEHFDSAGNHGIVHSGGVQWMNAGNGILHDETLNYDSKTNSGLIHGLQFWINLPSEIKANPPSYLAIQGSELPFKEFPDQKGWIKVIVGTYQDLRSTIPDYAQQFLYHIHLQRGADHSIHFAENVEVAAFLSSVAALINDEHFDAGEFIEYDRRAGEIHISNNQPEACDIFLFGGETYKEPIVADGPFVMNSAQGIAEAYKDFSAGKYGKINYRE